jgi:hypothetical protein
MLVPVLPDKVEPYDQPKKGVLDTTSMKKTCEMEKKMISELLDKTES